MMSTMRTYFTIQHADADVRRRGYNVVIIALGMIVTSIISIVGILLTSPTLAVISVTFVALALYLGVAVLAQRGWVGLGSWVLVLTPLVATLLSSTVGTSASPLVPFYLLMVLLVAGATQRPRDLAITLLLTLGAMGVLAWLLGNKPSTSVTYTLASLHGALLATFAGLAGLVSATSIRRAFANADQARVEAERNAAALAEMNTMLEARVQERTATLETTLVAQQTQAAALEAALVEQQTLSSLVAELSLPIIPVRADALVVPLVGVLDSARLTQLHSRLLEAVSAQHTRVVILDVTGVPLLDAAAAAGLAQLANAARLLGAQTMLVGIRPEVAQALVNLGVDSYHYTVAATLQQGLEQVLRGGETIKMKPVPASTR